jgi:MIP family channel proteins
MNNSMTKPAIAEFLGTFTLVFLGAAAVTLAGMMPAESVGPLAVTVPALAHGLALVIIVMVYGHISGAHVNPAVTAGLLVGGKITVSRAVVYWIAQFLGAIVAALAISALVPAGTNLGVTTGSLTADSVWTAAAWEFILTFLLVSSVYQAAVYGKAGNVAGLAIGLTLAACIFAGGPYTGASLNPARTLGPALIAGDLSYVPAYLIGIFAGGIAAGLLHTYVLAPDPVK